MSAGPLAGKRIVVTRPREQAEGLAACIREAGGEPLLFPTIEIRDLADLGPFRAIADRLEEFDYAIFVSPTSVRKALRLLRERRASRAWPARLRVAAIGRGSQRALRDEGVPGVFAPAGPADSEALLGMPAFASPAGRRIVIFRGRGGRELLGETLAARGAHVEYAECYVRARPDSDSGPWRATGSARVAIDAVTVTSGEGLANLDKLLDERSRKQLRQTPLFVPHARVAEQAEGLGMRRVTVSGPGDAEILAALVAYFGSAK